jgi:hypothetical protein
VLHILELCHAYQDLNGDTLPYKDSCAFTLETRALTDRTHVHSRTKGMCFHVLNVCAYHLQKLCAFNRLHDNHFFSSGRQAKGVKWILFFQDTNGLIFKVIRLLILPFMGYLVLIEGTVVAAFKMPLH